MLRFIALCYFVSFVIIDSKLLGQEFIPIRPLLLRNRWFRAVLQCYLCTGSWVAIALFPVHAYYSGETITAYQWLSWTAIAATASYALDHLFRLCEALIHYYTPPTE